MPRDEELGQKLLIGLAKSVELEHKWNEAQAIETWMTLELEVRPKSQFEGMGTDLQTCLDFVKAVEKAVIAKTVTVEQLRELWGCPPETLNLPPKGPVSLADVSLGTNGSIKFRGNKADGNTEDDVDDDDASDLSRANDQPVGNPDVLGVGDGRYT